MRGRVIQINVSGGGVPKLPVEAADVTVTGLQGDVQSDRKHHGGSERAVCLFAMEVIARLQKEGHPIAPGTAGENLTIQGLDWGAVTPGARLRFEGGVELEIASYTVPCSTIRGSFKELKFKRIDQDRCPGESRVYARVVKAGRVGRGEEVSLEAAEARHG
jgi:MOSC domain-containing protein YiiM